MGWIRVDIDMMGHPKIRRLATRLGCSKVQAIGHVIALWAWASKFSPHGETDKFEPEEIADGAMWDGDAGQFIQAMKDSGLIDADGILHDWQQYNGVLIEKRERDRERMQTLRKQSQDSRATVALQSQGVAGTIRNDTIHNDTEQKNRREARATQESEIARWKSYFDSNSETLQEKFKSEPVDWPRSIESWLGWISEHWKDTKDRKDPINTITRWIYVKQFYTKTDPKKAALSRKPWEGGCDDIGRTPEEIAAEKASGL